ncbi:MAG: hypothetical protein SVV03_06715 [Candidatus Nanohaloarchaea archaeon]|nr:hypothetical protein [Candidatus Nanohaloarchaea archaeon]
MEWPEETISKVRDIAEDLKSSFHIPRAIYDRLSEFEYGFSGSLEEEKSFRYPHELNGEANCYEIGVLGYVLAEYGFGDDLSLDPRFLEVDDFEESESYHGMIDVEYRGGRFLIDPFSRTFGLISQYRDNGVKLSSIIHIDETDLIENRSEIEDGEGFELEIDQDSLTNLSTRSSREYSEITEISERELLKKIKSLREQPARMLLSGQRIKKIEDSEEDCISLPQSIHLKFNREKKCLSWNKFFRDTSLTSYGLKLSVSRFFDEEAQVSREDKELSVFSGRQWNTALDENRLLYLGNNGLEFPEEFPESVKEDIAWRKRYRDIRDGYDLIYDQKTLYEHYIEVKNRLDAMHDTFTTFSGGNRLREICKIIGKFESDEEEYPWRELDYLFLRYNDEVDMEIPSDEEFKDLLLGSRFESLISIESPFSEEVPERAESVVKEYIEDNVVEDSINSAIERIKNYGISEFFEDIGSVFEAIYHDESKVGSEKISVPFTAMSLSELEDEYSFLIDNAETYGNVEDEETSKVLSKFDMFLNGVSIDLYDGLHLKSRISLKDKRSIFDISLKDDMSVYNSSVQFLLDFDDLGNPVGQRVRVLDYTENPDKRYILMDKEVDSFEAVDLEVLREEAIDRLPEILEKNQKDAIEPYEESNFIDRIVPAALWHSEAYKDRQLFSDERIESFYRRMLKEQETSNEVLFFPQEANEGDLEFIREIDLENESDRRTIQKFRLFDLIKRRDHGCLRGAIYHGYESEEEIMRAYVEKYRSAFDALYVIRESLSGSENQVISSFFGSSGYGVLELTIPGYEDVRDFAEDRDFEVLGQINEVLDSNKWWENKAFEMDSLLDDLEEIFTGLKNEWERRAIKDSLRSFEYRLHNRRRYQEWQEDSDLDLENQMNLLRSKVDEAMPVESIEDILEEVEG